MSSKNKFKEATRSTPKSINSLGMQGVKDYKYIDLEIDKIKENPYQPRVYFDEESIESLAVSIKNDGIIQPIIVNYQEDKDNFILISGDRRLRAAKKAGLKSVPVIVRQLGDKEVARISLIENIQRENLSPVDEIKGYERLMTEFGYNQQALSQELGVAKSSMAEYLSILRIPSELLEKCTGHKHVSKSHLVEIAKMPEDQMEDAIKDLIKNKSPIKKLRERRKNETSKRGSYKERAKQQTIIKLCAEILTMGVKENIVEEIFKKYNVELANGDEKDIQQIKNYIH
ncbi:MAG: ParB/RepB/Spo0J family partition protein [Nanobdellota archaeon]